MTITIRSGAEYMRATVDGLIYRPALSRGPSGAWRALGAVERNTFGYVVRSWTWAEIVGGATVPWRWKNGKQRCYLRDLDHGHMREWRNPGHEVRITA